MLPARRLPVRPAAALLAVAALAACDSTEVGMARGEALFDTCVPCHGADGAGNPELGAPTIAGLPAWYVQSQLEKFQGRARGYHPDDLEGMRMRPMAESLNKEGDVVSVAQYVASMTPTYPASTLRGDAGAGSVRYNSLCTVCHGPDGMGNEALGAPPIVLLDDWYLVGQLRKFKSGWRGTNPTDVWGGTMRPNTLALDDQAMLNVIAYVQTLR